MSLPSPNQSLIDDSSLDQDDDEPLGYQHYLYDVNIEYSPGGGRSGPISNSHSFKLKCLPYMIASNRDSSLSGRASFVGSNNSSSGSVAEDDRSINNQNQNSVDKSRLVDVTKATCAFLGNSDHVPNNSNHENRRVVLELISAKLSQTTSYYVPTSRTSTPSSTPSPSLQSGVFSSTPTGLGIHLPRQSTMINPDTNSRINRINHKQPAPAPSSKKFVNYTLLIKTAPGIDDQPAVIERRFSDFLQLYQGLKCQDSYSKILDKHVTFPKKIYMGNFSLNNIADRSIEFSRLLRLCMTNTSLMWSAPFISFLLDKELKEAHKLALCGDQDDVQALVETVYFILQKLYLNVASPAVLMNSTNLESPSLSLDNYYTDDSGINHRYSPSLPNRRPQIVKSSSSEETISGDPPSATMPGSSPSLSVCDTSEDGSCISPIKCGANSSALNQRILVTFCLLFLTYSRNENYRELKIAIKGFNQLVSSQVYVDSMTNTRHQITLRACLLFLMNIQKDDIIDENTRIWLKRKLEDIDGRIADFNELSDSKSNNIDQSSTDSPKIRQHNGSNGANCFASHYRVTKGDLTSLLKDRNFCSFQDGKFVI